MVIVVVRQEIYLHRLPYTKGEGLGTRERSGHNNTTARARERARGGLALG